jgi:hypothetical protein
MDQQIPKKKRIAILFFGLTRSLPNVYASLKENLFDVLTNNNIDYDNFIHTYTLSNPYKNPITKSIINNYDNDAYKLLNPRDYILQNQDLVKQKLIINQYYTYVSNWQGCAPTLELGCSFIRNMVLALYSKKKVVELFSKYKNEYDYVIITRPDQKLDNKFNINAFRLLNNNNIIIPKEHSYTGINDRICIASPQNAIIYGLAFDYLLAYSKKKAIVSEAYWKWYISNVCKLNIIYGSLLATLIRI